MDTNNQKKPPQPLPETQKEMVKAMETITDPTLKAIFSRILNHIKNSEIHKEVTEFKKEVFRKPPKHEQRIFAFLPHQLAKTSIFFPMSKREYKEENRKISKLEHQTSWGKVVIEGIKLAIFEEDIFLVLLYLAKDNTKKFENEFVLETNIKKLINLLYGRSGYSKRNEEVILKALKHFELVSFNLIVGEWKKKNKERLHIEKIRSIGNIVSGFTYDTNTKNIKIYFNPRFFEYFLESMLTNINFTLRRKLKKDGSKALLRFLSTHNNPEKMHILTVLDAINLNITQPKYRLRARLKGFITELKKNGILGPKTKVYSDDTVYFDILPFKRGTRLVSMDT